eukprot:TRINITY_DN48728_c0_g1_i1.p1 TRINITY_DN48728_c0_g1~~TRINITY_DN48728_c0_g1_i1.p1  ORF type:complete len:485 (+),score=32.85 TRINITY_DN48728_c0_g1_i1:54-1508(+)
MERPLDGWELMWVMLHDQGLFANFSMCATLRAQISDDQLESAVRRVIMHNPSLQVSLNRDTYSFFRIPMETLEVPIIHIDGNDESLEQILAKEVQKGFDTAVNKPLFRVTVRQRTEGSHTLYDLVGSFWHAIADGTSCLMFMKQLLAVLANDEMQSELKDNTRTYLAPGLMTLMRDRPRLCGCGPGSWLHIALFSHDMNRKSDWLLPKSAPPEGTLVSERSCFHIFVDVDAESMGRLLEKARVHRTTIHGALIASSSFALASLVASQDAKATLRSLSFIQETPINLRPHCGIPPDLMGAFVSSYKSRVAVKSKSSFWEQAIVGKRDLERAISKRSPMQEIGLFPEWQGSSSNVNFLRKLENEMYPPKHRNTRDPKHGRDEAIGITNLGRSGVQSKYGSGNDEIVVERFHWAGDCHGGGGSFYLRALSLGDGRLMVTVSYAHPVVEHKLAQIFATQFKNAFAAAIENDNLTLEAFLASYPYEGAA